MIDDKAKEYINSCARELRGETELLYSSTYIKQLNDHINGEVELTEQVIEQKLDHLIGFLTITLDLPVSDIQLLRARPCDNGLYSNVGELSYIAQSTATFPKQGRLNKTGKPIFYAAVCTKGDRALHVVLSEAGAKDLDQINILRSHQVRDTSLSLRILGIGDEVRRNCQPYFFADDTFQAYKSTYQYMEEIFDQHLLQAFQLTDRFLADIMSRKGHEKLYEVTSAAGSIMMDGNVADGILYSSVEAKGEPVIALKPASVDSKFTHKLVTDIHVHQHFGYEFYDYTTIHTSIVDEKGSFNWQPYP